MAQRVPSFDVRGQADRSLRIAARHCYPIREQLKARGYRWDGERGEWVLTLPPMPQPAGAPEFPETLHILKRLWTDWTLATWREAIESVLSEMDPVAQQGCRAWVEEVQWLRDSPYDVMLRGRLIPRRG